MKKTIKKLLLSVTVLAMLGGNGMYAFAKTKEYNDSDSTWEVTNTITVTCHRTTSEIEGAKLTKTSGYYSATATSYDKNGKNIVYKGVYKTGTGAKATAKKLFSVKKGKSCNWVNDENKNRCSKIWSRTMSK